MITQYRSQVPHETIRETCWQRNASVLSIKGETWEDSVKAFKSLHPLQTKFQEKTFYLFFILTGKHQSNSDLSNLWACLV